MEKNKYILFVNHKFDPGLTVAFKMRPIFKSPNNNKWVSAEGEWSREQTYEIPEDKISFNLELNGDSKKLSLDDDDTALTNFDEFGRKFLNEFEKTLKKNQKLELSVDGKVLNEKSKLTIYAKGQYVVRGRIMMSAMEKVVPPQKERKKPKIENVEQVQPGNNKEDVVGDGVLEKFSGPKQISTIVVFDGQKKRA